MNDLQRGSSKTLRPQPKFEIAATQENIRPIRPAKKEPPIMPAPRATYRVNVTRSRDWWIAEVEELERVYTQSKNLNNIEGLVSEVIELVHDIEPETFELDIHVNGQDFLGHQFEDFLAAREAHLNATEAAAKASRELAQRLVHQEGLTQADAGRVMELSPQRISQLLAAD